MRQQVLMLLLTLAKLWTQQLHQQLQLQTLMVF